MNEEKFSFYRHFAEKDSTKCATADQVHQIVSGATPWDVWVRGRPEKPTLDEYTNEIRQKRQMMIDQGYAKEQIKREFADIKKALPCVAWSSVMVPSRNANNAGHHSGLICVDFDGLDQVALDKLWAEVVSDKRTLFAFLSPSGAGVKVVARVSGQEAWLPKGNCYPQAELNKCLMEFHAAAVDVVWKHYGHLNVEIDEDCKDISRLCFLCWDDRAHYNPDSEAISVPPEDPIERAKRLASEKLKSEKKSERKSPTASHGMEHEEGVPVWLDSALKHLKTQEMSHGEKAKLVHSLATIFGGSDEGLQEALRFFRERTVGEQLDERQIETTYGQSNGSVTAGTLWHLARGKGWEPPKRQGPPTRGATQPEEADLNDILGAIDTSKPCGEVSDEIAGKSIVELADVTVPDKEVLLGNRFLCRGGGMLYVGPSGVGKSSSSMQQDICWAVGREAFGIQPARPLRILTIQAENDEGDLKEMAEGVLNGLALTPDDISLLQKNSRVVSCNWAVSDKFIVNVLVPALNNFRPDIVRIDPFNAYLGGAPKDTEKVIQFLRSWINPVAGKFKVGVIINHHTPKTNYRDTSNYKPGDWMYAGAGDSDMTNWARAILVIDHTKDSQVYRFIAAKRGTRLGWEDDGGSRTIEKYFIHANKRARQASRKDVDEVTSGRAEVADGLYWLEATPEEILASKKTPAKNTSDMDKIMRLLEYLSGRNLSDKERKRSQIEAWLMTSVKVAKTKAKSIVTAAVDFEFIQNLVPDSKKAKNSKYVVTEEGLAKLQEFTRGDGSLTRGSDFMAKMQEAV